VEKDTRCKVNIRCDLVGCVPLFRQSSRYPLLEGLLVLWIGPYGVVGGSLRC